MNFFLKTALLLLVLSACDTPEPPSGIPRCEPEGELLVERNLKLGFRHLFEGDSKKARDVFKSLLEQEPEHPEALLGLRQAEGVVGQRATGSIESRFTIAGRLIPSPVRLNSERFRYEYEAAGQRLRDIATSGDIEERKRSYGLRTDKAGTKVGLRDFAKVQKEIDTVVFHDSETSSVEEYFYSSAVGGESTHFIIDTDGSIFQSLDVVNRPLFCGIENIERRAISITMINPVDLSRAAHGARSKSAPVQRHGRKISHWGYTPSQRRSLNQLVAGLFGLMPQLKVTVPEDELGRPLTGVVSDTHKAKGLLGHFHLDSEAKDPTVAFPWDELKRYLSAANGQ